MKFDLSELKTLMGNSITLTKQEVIKRYRSLSSANYQHLQWLCMLPFCLMGKDEEGKLFYC